jgi:sugar phosphate isomerase/epimerase
MTFNFENHDGASLDPAICAEILGRVDQPNIRMNFDPINFARVGVDGLQALAAVQRFVGHVHLKGLERGEYCEFGAGDVDLMPVLRRLLDGGYTGQFTVEYEGPFDGTLRLYQSVRRADAILSVAEDPREERCHP